jgi:hypothetical protein
MVSATTRLSAIHRPEICAPGLVVADSVTTTLSNHGIPYHAGP